MVRKRPLASGRGPEPDRARGGAVAAAQHEQDRLAGRGAAGPGHREGGPGRAGGRCDGEPRRGGDPVGVGDVEHQAAGRVQLHDLERPRPGHADPDAHPPLEVAREPDLPQRGEAGPVTVVGERGRAVVAVGHGGRDGQLDGRLPGQRDRRVRPVLGDRGHVARRPARDGAVEGEHDPVEPRVAADGERGHHGGGRARRRRRRAGRDREPGAGRGGRGGGEQDQGERREEGPGAPHATASKPGGCAGRRDPVPVWSAPARSGVSATPDSGH